LIGIIPIQCQKFTEMKKATNKGLVFFQLFLNQWEKAVFFNLHEANFAVAKDV